MVETVNVKDKNGKPVEGLTRERLHGDRRRGRANAFVCSNFRKYPKMPIAEPPIPLCPSRFSKLPETQIAAEKPGDIRYQDRRLLVLYFDMTAMPPPDQAARPHGGRRLRTQAE